VIFGRDFYIGMKLTF